jgi:hypothetical protein
MDGENQRANDNDRYVLAAQPGKSQGRPKETSPRSKRIVQTGLPDCVLPESPCPGQPTVWSEPDSNLPSMIFMPRRAGGVVEPRDARCERDASVRRREIVPRTAPASLELQHRRHRAYPCDSIAEGRR